MPITLVEVKMMADLNCSDLCHWLCFLQDMGTVILGKLESGCISKAQQLVMMPNRVRSPLYDFALSSHDTSNPCARNNFNSSFLR